MDTKLSKIILRQDTTTNWANSNVILAQGEPAIDITSNVLKIGDGVKTFAQLDELRPNASTIGECPNDGKSYVRVYGDWLDSEKVKYSVFDEEVNNEIALGFSNRYQKKILIELESVESPYILLTGVEDIIDYKLFVEVDNVRYSIPFNDNILYVNLLLQNNGEVALVSNVDNQSAVKISGWIIYTK